MSSLLRAALGGAAILAASQGPVFSADTQTKPAHSRPAAASQEHRVVIQVSENDPKMMNLALNNAENLTNYYAAKGEKVRIELVAYGPGLNMMRTDTSPVKDRLAALSGRMKNVTFSGCGNTLENQSRQEEKNLSLVPEARIVPAGIARVVELEEQGWTYVRP